MLAEQGNNELEKFIIQQNYIQYLLAQIVFLRASFPDQSFIDKVENKTLGTLIDNYKICAIRSSSNEFILLDNLINYNKARNYLTHKLFSDDSDKTFDEEAKKANGLGVKIIEALKPLIEDKLNKLARHQALLSDKPQ